MPFLFEDLNVYQKSINLADEIHEITKNFHRDNFYLIDQLNRAALSIPSNIAEGNGRYHKAERNNFFRIARGSAYECIPILEISKRKGLINESAYQKLREDLNEICKMLAGLIKQ